MKLCIVTTSRSDYGILKPLIDRAVEEPTIECSLVVSGSHLSTHHGSSVDEIINDGTVISKKVEFVVCSNSRVGAAKTVGMATLAFSDAFEEISPDIVVLLGDRFELIGIATAAFLLRIPISHISGGDLTIGAMDDSVRHALTKLSSIHFPTTEAYRKRLIQLGETPDRVHLVGSLTIDRIKNFKPAPLKQLIDELKITPGKGIVLATFHPETNVEYRSVDGVEAMFSVLAARSDVFTIVTGANSDPGFEEINRIKKRWCDRYPDL